MESLIGEIMLKMQVMRGLYKRLEKRPVPINDEMAAEELRVLAEHGIVEVKEGMAYLLASKEQFDIFCETYKQSVTRDEKEYRKNLKDLLRLARAAKPEKMLPDVDEAGELPEFPDIFRKKMYPDQRRKHALPEEDQGDQWEYGDFGKDGRVEK